MKKGAPVKRASMKLCKVLSETVVKGKDGKILSRFKVNENAFKIKCDNDLSKETISKRMLECPVRNNSEPIVKIFNENSKKQPPCADGSNESVFNIACNTPNDLGNGQVKNDKEPVMKIASEPPIFAANNFSDEMESCRAAFQEFVRNRKEDAVSNKKTEEKKEVSKRTFVRVKREEKVEKPTDSA